MRKAEPQGLRPAKPRRIAEAEEDEDEIPDSRSRRQRFLDEQDLDEEEIKISDYEDNEPEPVKHELKRAVPQRKAFANPCGDDEDDDSEEEVPVKPKRVVTETKPDVPEEEERSTGLRPSNPVPKFTQIIGRETVAIPQPEFEIVKLGEPQKVVAPPPQPLPVTGVVTTSEFTEIQPVRLSAEALRGKVMQAMRDGLSDTSIALKFDTDVGTVLGIRKDYIKLSKANNPREVFSRRINDLDDAFEVARENFFENPASEIHFRAMTEFNRSLRETIAAFQELEDPNARAAEAIKRVIRPLLMDQLASTVDTMTKFKDDIVKFVPEHVKRIVETGVIEHIRRMSTTTIRHYNKAISTLEDMYGLDLDQYKQHQGSDLEPESQENGE